jgi:hypothetical protein
LDRARAKEHGSLRHPASLRLVNRLRLPRTGMSGLLEGPSFCSKLGGFLVGGQAGPEGMQGCHVASSRTDIPPSTTLDVSLSCHSVSGRSRELLSHDDVPCNNRGGSIVTTMCTCSEDTCTFLCYGVYVNTAISALKSQVI